MQLILLRHGEAEDASSTKADAQRDLTEQGVRKLRKALPGLKALIEDTKSVRIWTSPMNRAVQTAAILSECLSVDAAQPHPELSTGDWSSFIHEARKVEENICLILVGHEPYFGQWSERLCGCLLPFKKGAVAGFEFDPVSWDPFDHGQAVWQGRGELQWFVQPKVMKRL